MNQLFIKPSNAHILRVEIANPGLPWVLTDITTSRKDYSGKAKDNDGRPRAVFTTDDDNAVRNLIGAENGKATFEVYGRKYLALKEKYVRNILGYGNFILDEDVAPFMEEASKLNTEYKELRAKIMKFLEDVRHISHQDALLFNPRVKFGTFILSEAYARNKCFRVALENMKVPFKGKPTSKELLG